MIVAVWTCVVRVPTAPVLCVAALIFLSFALAISCAGGDPLVAEPDDYRYDDYRAPTPATLKGATVVDVDAARQLWAVGEAIWIDVMPRPRRPVNMPAGRPWLPEPRRNIPGSIWLPNVGFGRLPVEEDVYFADSLKALTQENVDRTLIFYCLRDCWMSWNAAKRAMAMGYRQVIWFPEGSDGWAEAGLPIADAAPYRDGSKVISTPPK